MQESNKLHDTKISSAIQLVSLTRETAEDAKTLARLIFPDESDNLTIESEIHTYIVRPSYPPDPDGIDPRKTAFYLARTNEGFIGLTGHYQYLTPSGEAWLSWFGLVPAARGRGWGKILLTMTMDILRNQGFHMLRLWTTDHPDDSIARFLYRSAGFVEEPFSPNFPGYFVYSLALSDRPLTFWRDLTDKPDVPGGLLRTP